MERQAGASRQVMKTVIPQGKAGGICWEHYRCVESREVCEGWKYQGSFREELGPNEAWKDRKMEGRGGRAILGKGQEERGLGGGGVVKE